MDSVLDEEDSSAPLPRIRRWPRLKPLHKSTLLPSASQLDPSIIVGKARTSTESVSSESGLGRTDQTEIALPEAETDPAGVQEEQKLEPGDSSVGVDFASSSGRSDGIEEKRGARAEDSERTLMAATREHGLIIMEPSSICVAKAGAGGSVPGEAEQRELVTEEDPPTNRAENKKAACHIEKEGNEGKATSVGVSVEASMSRDEDPGRSEGHSERRSGASVAGTSQQRRKGRVSESLADIAHLLNRKKGRENEATDQQQMQCPSSALLCLQEKREGPLRRSVLTPRSVSLDNSKVGGHPRVRNERGAREAKSKRADTSGSEGKQNRPRSSAERVPKTMQSIRLSRVETNEPRGSASVHQPFVSQCPPESETQSLEEKESQQVRDIILFETTLPGATELTDGGAETLVESLSGADVEASERPNGSEGAGLGPGSIALATGGVDGEAIDVRDGLQAETRGMHPEESSNDGVANSDGAVATTFLGAHLLTFSQAGDGPKPVVEKHEDQSDWGSRSRSSISKWGRDSSLQSVPALRSNDIDDSAPSAPPARASLSAQKLSSILKYLEEVNSSEAWSSAPTSLETDSTLVGANNVTSAGPSLSARIDENESEAGYAVNSVSTASLEAASKMRRLENSSGATSEASFLLERTPRHANGAQSREQDMSATGSSSPASRGAQGPSLAASVYQGVKAKLRALKGEIALRDEAIAGLREEGRAAQEKHTADLQELELRHAASCQRQQAEYEAALARHLAFVDKLLGDKDKLAAKCTQMAADVKATEAKLEERLRGVQEQSARELKKAREQWAAAEKVKREQWMAAKVNEIKAMTVKGLEPQLQRLIEKHKSDVQRLEARHVAELRLQVDKMAATHEQEQRYQRERLLKEKDEAIEQERNSAQTRLREQSERYEQQLLLARMRVGSDMAVQIERAEAARRDDKKRADELLSLKTLEAQEREAALRQEMARAVQAAAAEGRAAAEKAAAQVAQEKKEWESALQERVREECARSEAEMRRRCDEQMRDELKVVVARLAAEKEEELEARVSAAAERARQAEAEAEGARRERDSLEARLEKRIQSAVQAKADALEALVACQEQREGLAQRTDTDSRKIHSLKTQMEALTQKLESSDVELRSRVAERTEQLRKQLVEADCRGEQLKQQLHAAVAANETARTKQAEELSAVDAQVRQAIAARDANVTALQRQLEAAQQRIRDMEQQQRDLLNTSL